MAARVMGTIGGRRLDTRKQGATPTRVSTRATCATNVTETYPLFLRSTRTRIRFHDEAGTRGEAYGLATARNALFLATESLLPLGTPLILETPEGDNGTKSQTVTGRVIAVYPIADEFGFPPGIGVSVSPGGAFPPER